MAPHSAMRVVESKIRDMRDFIRSDDPVWSAIDDLWEFVILGKRGAWIDPACGCERSPDVARSVPCPVHAGKKEE